VKFFFKDEWQEQVCFFMVKKNSTFDEDTPNTAFFEFKKRIHLHEKYISDF